MANVTTNETVAVAASAVENNNFLITAAIMILNAAVVVYIGSFRSFIFAMTQRAEVIQTKDALRMPIIGSCVLLGLYCLIKFVSKDILMMFLSGYLTLISIGALAVFLRPYIGASIPIGCACIGIGISFYWTKHWAIQNVLAFAISVVGIEAVQMSQSTKQHSS